MPGDLSYWELCQAKSDYVKLTAANSSTSELTKAYCSYLNLIGVN